MYNIEVILSVKKDELKEFEAIDEFNNNNVLRGFLCRRGDYRYGALIITSVNDEECLQVIYCTPKLDYPFDRNGKYHFPDVRSFKFYEKMDGTNIFVYHYLYKENDFITYKTRLTPVLKNQKFGEFKNMWLEYMNDNPWVKEIIDKNPHFNLSFELFGSRNPYTIMYDFPLDVNLLFGVRIGDAAIRPPSELECNVNTKIPRCFDMVGDDGFIDIIDRYNKHREYMSMKNQESLVIEGMVQYCHVGMPSWKMFKCKPEEIERIHWSASGYIPTRSLFNTALNVFESVDNPTIQDFIELLKEEYPQELITKSYLKIERNWLEAVERVKFTKLVNEIWIHAKESGLDVTRDKNETMRFMSKHFPKGVMKKVGSAVLKMAGLLNEKRKR